MGTRWLSLNGFHANVTTGFPSFCYSKVVFLIAQIECYCLGRVGVKVSRESTVLIAGAQENLSSSTQAQSRGPMSGFHPSPLSGLKRTWPQRKAFLEEAGASRD